MKLRVLGSGGGIGSGSRTSSILVDDDVLIDAGTGVQQLDIAELRRIRHVFLTHSHLDHIVCLPLLVDTAYRALQESGESVLVHGRPETLDALRRHVFNWDIWPDFSKLPDEQHPSLRYRTLAPGDQAELGGRCLRPIDVEHVIPTQGYRIDAGDRICAISGDTTVNDSFWEALNAAPRLDVLIVETSFPDADVGLAELSRHYCPRTLAPDLAKLRHQPAIYVTHMKPGCEDVIWRELHQALPGRSLERLRDGMVIEI